MPRPIERGAEGWALDEVLTMSGVGFEAGQPWKAEATLDLFDSPWDDVASTLPVSGPRCNATTPEKSTFSTDLFA